MFSLLCSYNFGPSAIHHWWLLLLTVLTRAANSALSLAYTPILLLAFTSTTRDCGKIFIMSSAVPPPEALPRDVCTRFMNTFFRLPRMTSVSFLTEFYSVSLVSVVLSKIDGHYILRFENFEDASIFYNGPDFFLSSYCTSSLIIGFCVKAA